MNKIKEFTEWWCWLTQSRLLLGLLFLYLAMGVAIGSFVVFTRVFDCQFTPLSIAALSIGLLVGIFVIFLLATFTKYRNASTNWRIAIAEGWEFAKKNPEALSDIEKWIAIVKCTKDPSELNKFMENWKSREEKKTKLFKELQLQKVRLKETEDIMSGKKAEQIKEEIEKIKEEIKKV